MRKTWKTWALVVCLLLCVPWLMAARCDPSQPEVVVVDDEQEQQGAQQDSQQSTPANMDYQKLQEAGVPVYPSCDPAPVRDDVEVNQHGHYTGDILLKSSTCPPENVAKFYDSMLAMMNDYKKETTGTGTIRYSYTTMAGEMVAISLIDDGDGDPSRGTDILISFNTY